MTGFAARIASWFVAPRALVAPSSEARSVVAAEGAPSDAAARPPGRVAVLCEPRDALAVGSAVALVLARVSRAPCALVATWSGTEEQPLAGAAAAPAARRLAERAATDGFAAAAAGRLAHVRLPAAAQAAAAAAALLAARAGGPSGMPCVTVVGAVRPSAFDVLLRKQDAVIVVASPAARADVHAQAVADAARVAHRVIGVKLDVSAAGRALLPAGLVVPPRIARPLATALTSLA